MTRTAEEFYALRDQRSAQILQDDLGPVVEAPVCIVVGQDAAETREGQVCALALVNMLARLHRRLRVVAPDTDLVAQGLRQGESRLPNALRRLAKTIDPFIGIDIDDRISPAVVDGAVTVGLGSAAPPGLQLYLTANGAIGGVTAEPEALASTPSTVLGASMAACLGARAVLGCALGQPTAYERISVWNFSQGDIADPGPVDLDPIDVGETAMIGAGAVGSALAYWLAEIGHVGAWEVVDKDIVQLHNTNRCLTLTAANAGWPDGSPLPKADPAARLIGADSVVGWYHEWVDLRRAAGSEPDLVLVLANEHGVRHVVGWRYEPILLHASTSRQWTAELHRQIAGLDDCIDCRLGGVNTPALACGEGQIDLPARDIGDSQEVSGGSADAALPFLSGSAGLLLASALRQLQLGVIRDHPHNHWRLLLQPSRPGWARHRRRCESGCEMRLLVDVLADLTRDRRWTSVVPRRSKAD